MVFFSDLDRTIIYSKRVFKNFQRAIPIEIYNGEEITFITDDIIKKMQNIQEKAVLIPTTTRTTEQFKRIEFNKFNIKFPLAITSNGGVILEDGKELEEWNVELKKELSKILSLKNAMKEFDKYSEVDGIKAVKEVPGLFFYMVVRLDEFDFKSLDKYEEYLLENNWKMYITGRKIYFIPNPISKENAMRYLIKKYFIDEKTVIASGDSLMDLGIITEANLAFVPRHNTINEDKFPENKDIILSEKSWEEATEEILEKIILINKNN